MRRRTPVALALVALVAAAVASVSAGARISPTPVPAGGLPQGLAKALAAQQRLQVGLLDKPGVAGVGVGLNKAGEAVLTVYKERPNVAVPTTVGGVAVQSVTTGIIQPRAPTDRFVRPVPIGVSSGVEDIATGTIGARVTDGTHTFALSNNHVFAAINSASIGDGIIQPGAADGGSDPADRIGTLYAYQPIDFDTGSTNTIDAALALTSTGNVGTSTPADGYGTPSAVTAPAYLGQPVQKYGRTTGFQQGTVAGIDVTVDVCYLLLFNTCFEQARFVNQVSVSPGTFSAPGDSGSLIVAQSGNQPVALLFAGGDGLTIGNPIDAVLQHFGVTIEGSVPTNGPPSAPTALADTDGDGHVALSWSAPSFDGGSTVSGYRVYRGASPGSESFLADAGSATTYDDTSVANGTTYYYRVSALNAVGEGPLSNEVSARPSAAPATPLPTLDGFNRPDENPLAGGWSNSILAGGESGLKVVSGALACTRTTTCTGWRNDAQYGPDTEVWATITTLPGTANSIRLNARLQQPGTSGPDGYELRTLQQTGTDQVLLERIDNGSLKTLLTLDQELSLGDTLLLRVQGSTLEAWRYDGTSWSKLGSLTDTTYPAAGYVGVGLRGTTARLDDFGARGLGPPSAPAAPTALSASAGNALVHLSWSVPGSDGGSPLTGYRVYRGTSAGTETPLASPGLGTTYDDTSVANGTTYYYRVSALNAVGEGPLSNEVSARPSAAPATPLPTLDGFNRPDENPLAGGWSNSILAGGESGLKVVSGALACTRTTTCTGWRNDAQYGPDTEVWATITTLPGTANSIRLNARLQQPGTSGPDGYELRTLQQTGTDQVLLERIDNGSLKTLLTLDQELSLGDTLLLRVQGSTLEAWRYDGTSWSKLGSLTDTTYPAAGYVGVGLRGTTARLDDFGARGLGPPSAPAAPTALSASAGNALVHLSWSVPGSDGGSPLTGYRVYRGTSAGTETPLASPGLGTTYDDTSVANGTTYYYRVSALNAVGEGPLSNEVSARPSAAPATPLPTLDGFNRPDENPLAGGWSNSILAGGESGLKVVSGALACTRTTTCTGWRNDAQYGPDTEVWATITTLPGTANSIRLNARLQQPGTSGPDGYELRTLQQTGTDQVLLERIDNGSLKTLLTLDQELSLGDTLLLRVQGSTLEAWRYDGTSWSKLGSLTDTTYPAAGYVGVGLRGTTARLDDFGARTLS